MSDLPTREDWPAAVPAHGGDTREWPAVRPGGPPPPRSGMGGCAKALITGVVATLVLGTGACVAVVAAVDHAGRLVRQSQDRERLDVAAPACRVDRVAGVGLMTAAARVTNHSSKRSNYLIRVTFEGGDGGQLATSGTVVSALEPGQSTTATAHALQGPPDGGAFTCRVVTVERLSDEG